MDNKQPTERNEGEGNRSADHNYRNGIERSKRRGDLEDAAERARKAIDGAEADELNDARRQAANGETIQ